MTKSRIYPPRGSSLLPNTRDLSADSDDEFLNVFSSLDSLEESDNDIKSIILDQLRKYRHVSVRIKKNPKGDNRFAILSFDNEDALNYFKRAILEKRDRIIVYDKVLFFNFNHSQRNVSVHQRVSNYRDRRENSRDRNDSRRNTQNRRQNISISRTLFVGNLDDNVESPELQKLFEPFGELLEVVIKHPPGNRSAPYAFVKFRKLSSSMTAREQLQETFVGRKRLKIGFGKVSPSHALWVGGLNDTTTEDELLTEIKRNAKFATYLFNKTENMAYFVFETIEDCRRAYNGLINTKLVHSGAKLDIDYADTYSEAKDLMENVRIKDERKVSRSSSKSHGKEKSQNNMIKGRSRSIDSSRVHCKRRGSYSTSSYSSRHRSPANEIRRSSPIASASYNSMDNCEIKSSQHKRNDDLRKYEENKRDSSISSSIKRGKSYKNEQEKEITMLNSSKMIISNTGVSFMQIVNTYPIVWKGGINVKNNVSFVQLHLVCGSVDAVSTMVHQATLEGQDATYIHLTKRFPLLPDRVTDLRIKLAKAIASRDCCILLAQSCSHDSRISSGMTQKPLPYLISYFQQKQAAGIGSICGISIYAFPPSPFTQEQLTTLMPHAGNALNNTDNYLMVVISR